jgi:YhcH/YjgK/YiaL family protein
MIIDTLANASTYYHLHTGFEAAFRFMEQSLRIPPGPGRYAIDGDKIYASISQVEGKGSEKLSFEYHRRYIDIHFCLSGSDTIAWTPLPSVEQITEAFNTEKDCGFFSGLPPEGNFIIGRDRFLVCFPHDGHAPLIGTTPLLKAVIKIEV